MTISAAAQQAVELLVELVGIDSVNPGLVQGAAGEASIVEALRQRLERSGFATTIVHARDRLDRPSPFAVWPGPDDAPTVVLNGHLDTVGVAEMPDPFTARIDGDRLYARGAADMKGGVAAMVVAAEQLVAQGARVRPALALVADEEDASLGSEAIIAALRYLGVAPVVCLIAEPTGLALARSLRGFGVARVKFPGRAAHSSQPELGVNAVAHMGTFISAVNQRAAMEQRKGGDLMVTVARGGTSPFVVADSAECITELRTPPEARGREVLAVVAGLIDPTWGADVDLLAARDGWQLDTSGPAAKLAARLGAVLGTSATFDAPYWMEAPLWQEVCPTVICGPTGGGMHAVDEWVELQQVRRFTDALIAVLHDWQP